MFSRRAKGFTLVELLIVVAILGLLVAVVVPSLIGLMSKGGRQAYDADEGTISLSVKSYYADVHGGYIWTGNPTQTKWGCTLGGRSTHVMPTALVDLDRHVLRLGNSTEDQGNPIVLVGLLPATDNQIDAHAVWFGLLTNNVRYEPSYNSVFGTSNRWAVASLADETCEYIEKIPKSADAAYNGNAGGKSGTYTWVVAQGGKVYGVYEASDGNWYAGFKGVYP